MRCAETSSIALNKKLLFRLVACEAYWKFTSAFHFRGAEHRGLFSKYPLRVIEGDQASFIGEWFEIYRDLAGHTPPAIDHLERKIAVSIRYVIYSIFVWK